MVGLMLEIEHALVKLTAQMLFPRGHNYFWKPSGTLLSRQRHGTPLRRFRRKQMLVEPEREVIMTAPFRSKGWSKAEVTRSNMISSSTLATK